MGDETMSEGGEVDVPVVDLATIVARVVGKIMPVMVEDAVRREIDARVDGIVTLADEVHAAVEAGAFDDVHDAMMRSYARHLARLAIEGGVGMSEYAKMRREVRERRDEQKDGE